MACDDAWLLLLQSVEVAGLLQQLGNAPPPVQVYSIPSLPFPSLTSFRHRMLSLSRWLHFCRIQAIRFESLPPGLYVASAILHHFECRKLDKLQRDLTTSLTPGSSPDAPTHMDLRLWCPLYPNDRSTCTFPTTVLRQCESTRYGHQLLKRAGER
jgi:hypothetical protein